MMKYQAAMKIGSVCCCVMMLAGCSDLQFPDPDVMYIAFGDSATNGPSDKNYHAFLREMLGEPRSSLVNEGMGGETSGEGLSRLRDLLANELYPNASVLLYWEGGVNITGFIRQNDSFLTRSPDDEDYPFTNELTRMLDQLQSDLESGITEAQERQLTVYIATYFPLFVGFIGCDTLPLNLQFSGQAVNGQAYIDLLNERIRLAAENTRAILVDVATDGRIPTNSDHYEDCNHMSVSGNELVAETFFEVLSNQPAT